MLDGEALKTLMKYCEFCTENFEHNCGDCPVDNSKFAINKLILEEKKNG